jgi:DNA-binding response OmpR family regulator
MHHGSTVIVKFGMSPDCPTTLRDKRILVVEDEAIVAMLVEDGLLDAGAKVLGPATSVGEALHLIERAASDGGLSAAVLDINLNGEAVAPVADMLAALGVPFLFATGYVEGCDTGGHTAAPILHKPFDPMSLVAAVDTLASGKDGAAGCMRRLAEYLSCPKMPLLRPSRASPAK